MVREGFLERTDSGDIKSCLLYLSLKTVKFVLLFVAAAAFYNPLCSFGWLATPKR